MVGQRNPHAPRDASNPDGGRARGHPAPLTRHVRLRAIGAGPRSRRAVRRGADDANRRAGRDGAQGVLRTHRGRRGQGGAGHGRAGSRRRRGRRPRRASEKSSSARDAPQGSDARPGRRRRGRRRGRRRRRRRGRTGRRGDRGDDRRGGPRASPAAHVPPRPRHASAVPQAVARFRIPGGRRSAPGVLQEGEGAHGPVHAAVEGGQRRVRHDGRVPQGRPPHRGGREDLLGRAGAGTTRGERGRVGRKRFRRRGGTQGCLPRARAGGYRPRARGPAGPEPRATMRRHREAQGRAGERRRRDRRGPAADARRGRPRGAPQPPRRRRRSRRAGGRRGQAQAHPRRARVRARSRGSRQGSPRQARQGGGGKERSRGEGRRRAGGCRGGGGGGRRGCRGCRQGCGRGEPVQPARARDERRRLRAHAIPRRDRPGDGRRGGVGVGFVCRVSRVALLGYAGGGCGGAGDGPGARGEDGAVEGRGQDHGLDPTPAGRAAVVHVREDRVTDGRAEVGRRVVEQFDERVKRV
mmetsp:Transcript_11297/g.48793  ORF Transcript_11297/g.48793 Transcript_11297/m.48793 type:complete len:523 (-) Transcript_11297:22-1590(-)